MTSAEQPAPEGAGTPTAPPTSRNWMWRVLRGIVATLFPGLLRWRHTVEGIEHVPTSGPAVITWNHHSYADFLLLGLAIVDGTGRVVRILGKSEVWDNPVLGWIADRAFAVPVFRGQRGGGGALSAAIQALHNGDMVALAPEQTISQSFELLPFAPGAALMAVKTGVPVVPSVGWGSHRFTTKGHTLDTSNAVGLEVVTRFGPPLHAEPGEDVDAFNDRLRAVTEQMLHEVQEAYPDRPASDENAWWLPRRLGGAAPDHAEVMAAHTADTERRRAGRAARDAEEGSTSDGDPRAEGSDTSPWQVVREGAMQWLVERDPGQCTGHDPTPGDGGLWILNAMYEWAGPPFKTDMTHHEVHRHLLESGDQEPLQLGDFDELEDDRLVVTGGALGWGDRPGKDWVRLSWADLAARSGDEVATKGLNGHWIPAGRGFHSVKKDGSWPATIVPPAEGSMDRVSFRRLMEILLAHSGPDADVFLHWCMLQLGLHDGDDACVYTGQLRHHDLIEDLTPPGWTRPFHGSPANMWAADNSWVTWTDWDLSGTKIVGPDSLLDQVHADDVLETMWLPPAE